MMKLCCASWGFRFYGIKDYIEAASKLGFEYIEINCHPDIPLHLTDEMTRAELMQIRSLALKNNVRIVAIAGGNDFLQTDLKALNKQIQTVKRTIEITSDIGAEIVRIFAGFTPEEKLNEDSYKIAADAINEVDNYAQKMGVRLAIENHGGITGKVSSIKHLFDYISSFNVGLTYDPANFVPSHEEPTKILFELPEKIFYVHLKDALIKNGESEYCKIGQGIVDYNQILQQLANRNGYMAIEYENASNVEEGTLHDLQEIKRILHELRI